MTSPRTRSTITALPDNLADAWAATLPAEVAVAAALRTMNVKLDRNHLPQQFQKWRRGDEAIPDLVQDYMRRDILRHVLGPKTGEAMADRLEPMRVRVYWKAGATHPRA